MWLPNFCHRVDYFSSVQKRVSQFFFSKAFLPPLFLSLYLCDPQLTWVHCLRIRRGKPAVTFSRAPLLEGLSFCHGQGNHLHLLNTTYRLGNLRSCCHPCKSCFLSFRSLLKSFCSSKYKIKRAFHTNPNKHHPESSENQTGKFPEFGKKNTTQTLLSCWHDI